jgi:hypothetical protein
MMVSFIISLPTPERKGKPCVLSPIAGTQASEDAVDLGIVKTEFAKDI